ncbi:hypothetical protein PVK06_003101 [Gossypium arboreum]|uniref:Yippee domain-containing protein n=1 Tax=Gossypium arboreum TaxID=29729 RepID=A0ABR0R6N6_GOSAR|nr:hypothetical protein PVK06_003101 [Gossypium arboreum]
MDNQNDSGSSPPQVPSLNLMPPPPNVVRYGSSSSSQVPCLNTMSTPPKPSSQVPSWFRMSPPRNVASSSSSSSSSSQVSSSLQMPPPPNVGSSSSSSKVPSWLQTRPPPNVGSSSSSSQVPTWLRTPPPPNVGSSSSSQVPSWLRTPPPPNVGSSSSPQVPFSQPRPNIVRYPMNSQNISGSSSSSPQFRFPCVFPTPPNAVRYPITSLSGFYLCRNCRNHISCWTNVIQRVPGSLQIPGVSGDAILCRDAVNVKIDKSRGWYINNLPVVCFHCRGCNTTLGEKFGPDTGMEWKPVVPCSHA